MGLGVVYEALGSRKTSEFVVIQELLILPDFGFGCDQKS
jgi:hypothetical protein